MQGRFYPVTLYVNEKFMEDYLKPFLQIALTDPKISIKKEKGQEKQVQSDSYSIRALIKMYVDFKKTKMLKETKNENSETKEKIT